MRKSTLKLSVMCRFAIMSMSVVMPVSAPVLAQSFTTNGSGQYTGVTGLNVAGTLYDVTFVDGSCNALFNNCTTFDFDIDNANLAADALLAAVESNADLKGSPQKAFGCGAAFTCDIYIPFYFFNPDSFAVEISSTLPPSTQLLIPPLYAADTSNDGSSVWARFALAATAPVPEPATWAMMLLGFGAIGFQLRRKRTQNSTYLSQIA